MNLSDRIYDLGSIWRCASEIFPYFDRCGFDWDEKYREYLDKIDLCGDERDFHLLLAEFINLLGDGHTDYVFPKDLAKGVLPFGFLYSAGRYYIREIAAGGEGFLLAEVLALNGRDFGGVVEEVSRYAYHVGSYIWPGRLRSLLPLFLQEKDNVLETDAGVYRFDLCEQAPEMVRAEFECGSGFERLGPEWLDMRLYGDGKLYVKLDDCLHGRAGDEIAGAIKAHRPGHVILDVRDNIGGMTRFGAAVAEKFISGEIHACQKRTRSTRGIDMACASQYAGMSAEETAQYENDEGFAKCMNTGRRVNFEEYTDCWGSPENKAVFDGPVSILAGRDTISAAEDTLAMFRASHRARIIGAPTCGTTGTPYLGSLRCGGRFRVCSVGYRLLDGTEFIRRGIEPDVYLEPDMELLRKGIDNVLEYALEYEKDTV